MITKELIEYIKSERAVGVSDETIKQSLVSGGWNMSDAQEAFISLGPVSGPVSAPAAPVTAPVNAFSPAAAVAPVTTMPQTSVQPAPKSKKGGLIIITVLFLLVVGGAVYAYLSDAIPFLSKTTEQKNLQTDLNKETPVLNQNQASPTSAGTASATVPTAASAQSVSADNLWPLVDAYVAALRNKDVTALNAISYHQVSTSTPSTTTDALLSYIYEDASKLRSSDFSLRVRDDRQAIYSSSAIKENSTTTARYSRNTLFFIKDKGVWKLLKDSSLGWSVLLAGTNKGPVQIEADLQAMMNDADKDGITDMDENCAGSKIADKTCVKTNPSKDDTDGDGWWDGIDQMLI